MTVMADGSGGASTAELVYPHLVATGVTVMDNIGGHGSGDGFGGGNSSGGNSDNGDSRVDIGGGDDGYAPVAGDSGPPPNWVVENSKRVEIMRKITVGR